VKQTPSDCGALTWCHACPKCLLPFAIVPYPNMTCVRGPMLPKAESVSCPMKYQVRQSNQNREPLSCPLSCLEQEVTSEFRSESDTVFIRQCPIPWCEHRCHRLIGRWRGTLIYEFQIVIKLQNLFPRHCMIPSNVLWCYSECFCSDLRTL
jgi:hypothetical protein